MRRLVVAAQAAYVALTDRAELLTEAALEIETNLHIAGASAIEDKLQVGVPATIATLEKAGIKRVSFFIDWLKKRYACLFSLIGCKKVAT
jgi:magnesium-transporting ATPase (P-type)